MANSKTGWSWAQDGVWSGGNGYGDFARPVDFSFFARQAHSGSFSLPAVEPSTTDAVGHGGSTGAIAASGFFISDDSDTFALTAANLQLAGITAGPASLDKLAYGLAEIFVESQVDVAGMAGQARSAALADFTSVNTAANVREGMVAIDAVATDGDGAALLDQLKALGMVAGASYGALAGGYIPLDKLDEVAALDTLDFARPSYVGSNVGSVTQQPVQSMNVDYVQTPYGFDGSGLTIGILSDSFDKATKTLSNTTLTIHYAQDVASGDLPSGVNILQDNPSSSGTYDEGRGMAQGIYDIAPGANLAFATAYVSMAGFASNIVALAGISDIVVDDVYYYAEPFFQDGVIAQAVDTATSMGAMYFSSAGNQASQSYESAFVDSGQTIAITGANAGTYRLMDFDPGSGVDVIQKVTKSGTVTIALNWDQPSASTGGAGSASDLVLIMYRADGSVLGAVNANNIGHDAIEIAQTSSAFAGIGIGVRVGNADPGMIKYVTYGNLTVNEYATNSGTSVGHANAATAISVGASDWVDSSRYGTFPVGTNPFPYAETFTSKGGVPIYFDAAGNRLATPVFRSTVDLTGSDGGNTTFFGVDVSYDADSLPNFYGTSQAAPNVAAVAALLKQAYPEATNAQIEAALKASALDITYDYNGNPTGVGYDITTGAGLIQADAALRALQAIFPASLSIGDVSHPEPGSGTTTFTFTVSLTHPAPAGGVTFDIATADNTAIAGSDYVAKSLTGQTIAEGSSTYTFTVEVNSDAVTEGDETFLVNVSNVTGATVGDAQAVGTIQPDVNDAPTLTATALDPTYVENGAGVTLFSNVMASTVESGQLFKALTLTITNVESGHDTLTLGGNSLVLTNGAAGSFGGATATVSITGTTATITVDFGSGINAATLQSVFGNAAYSYSGDDPTANDRVVTITSLTDNGGNANGGHDTATLSLASTVHLTPVNDAPVNIVPPAITLREDASPARVFSAANGNALNVSDADAGSGPLTVTLSVGHGTLSLAGLAGVTITGSGTATVTLSGSAADLNAALNAGLTYTAAADYFGSDTLTFETSDAGASGSGGTKSDTDTIGITIVPIADIIRDQVTVSEDASGTRLNLLANDTFESPDRAITAVGSAAHGTVTINTNGTVLDTTDDYVVYTANADYNGTDSFTYTVTSGGVTETASVSVTVRAIGDIVGDRVTILEDAGATRLDLLANDTFESPGRAITAVGAAAHGTVTINDNGTAADKTDDYVVYTADADYHGTDSFTYTVTSGGVTETATARIVVQSVNDAPEGTDGGAAITSDLSYTFVAADFGFHDSDGDSPRSVYLTTVSSGGDLVYDDGVHPARIVHAGATVTFDAIQHGYLSFVPHAGATGALSFTFQVRDDGGTANGGSNMDATPNTFTVTVDPGVSSIHHVHDRQYGGTPGHDRLVGGHGNDVLVGGKGVDVLTGGHGNDVFRFETLADFGHGAKHDRITDFAGRHDVIDLSAIDPDGKRAGDQAFRFIGGAAFTGHGGTGYELRAEAAGHGNIRVMGDIDHDGAADFSFLVHAPALNAADFVL